MPLIFAIAFVLAVVVPPLERVTTAVPYPRGLAMVDGELYVLCRGRVRGRAAADGTPGGVQTTLDDEAGTVYAVAPDVAEPVDGWRGKAVRTNGRVFARPTDPPFRLLDRTLAEAGNDRRTDRPYCTLRYDAATDSFYICAFSGIDGEVTAEDRVAFRKNRADAVLRLDRRTRTWTEVERHAAGAGETYPHDDPLRTPPPHGWLNGPDNCLPVADGLYVVAKDNSVLVRYDLTDVDSPGATRGEVVLGADIEIAGHGRRRYEGHSALAMRDGWLYIAYRTSSVIVRIGLDEHGRVTRPIVGELVARFAPFDPATGTSANLTDMTFDEAGRLYVMSAQPARVYRFVPDPAAPFDGRQEPAWLNLAEQTGTPMLKGENVLCDGGWLYVATGDAYGAAAGRAGTVYRAPLDPPAARSSNEMTAPKTACEKCGERFAAGAEAYECSYRCTFCAACTTAMKHVCPNCQGRLERRTAEEPSRD